MNPHRNELIDLITAKIKDPAKPALQLHTGAKLTYGELTGIITQTRLALQEFGIRDQDRIGLVSDDMITKAAIMIGIMECAVLSAWDMELDREQHIEQIKLLNVDYLMCSRETEAISDAARMQGTGLILFQVDVDRQIVFKLISGPHPSHAPADSTRKIACVFTTSGTTSTPKVIPRCYDDMVQSSKFIAAYEGFDQDSVLLLPIRLEREISQRLLIMILISNGRLVYTDGPHPQRICAALQQHRITHFMYQPAGMIALLDYIDKNGLDCSPRSKINLFLAGAPVPPDLRHKAERNLNANVIIEYGMTEVGHITSDYRAPHGYREGSVGSPVHLEVRVNDGEIQVKGPHLFPGYENDPGGSGMSFVDGWFRTGDAGYLDQEGYLFITGRIKEFINRGGEKVSPYEIEAAIRSLGNFQDVAVFPYPNRKGYDNVGAVVVNGTGPQISLRELRSALKDRIKPYKLPTMLYRVQKIPLSSANKVQRRRLHAQLEASGCQPETLQGSPPEGLELTATQYVIQRIWREVLELDSIAPDDDFFDIGGDSLGAAEVLAAIEASLGCVLPVNEIFTKSTIRELAQLVDTTPASHPYRHLVPIRPGGRSGPIYFVHDLSGDVVTYHHLVDALEEGRPVFGLKLNLSREDWGPATKMQDIALAYAGEIQRANATGPYYLAGLSIGGQIAFEIGALLADQGFAVIVFMLDTYSRTYARNTSVHSSVKGTIHGFRNAPMAQWPRMFYQKAKTLHHQYVLSELSTKTRRLGARRLEKRWSAIESEQERRLMFIKTIQESHQPAPIKGKVVYFRALQSKLNSNPSYRLWKSLSAEFKLLEKDCRHADFVLPEYATFTAENIDVVLQEFEKNLEPSGCRDRI